MGGLLAYLLSSWIDDSKKLTLLQIMMGINFLLSGIGYSLYAPSNPRSVTNARVVVTLSIVIATIMLFVFSFYSFAEAVMIVPNALIILISLLLVRSIYKSQL